MLEHPHDCWERQNYDLENFDVSNIFSTEESKCHTKVVFMLFIFHRMAVSNLVIVHIKTVHLYI